MKTFTIIAPNYKRPQILEIWCAGIKRLREDIGYDFGAVVASDVDDIEVCWKYGINHVIVPNKPITHKFNRACSIAGSMGSDFVIITGSDNLLSTSTLKNIMVQMEKGYDLIGVSDIYFYATDDAHKGTLTKLESTKMLGVAKCISSKVMDKVDWRPWNIPKNIGMDWVATQNIRPHVETESTLKDQFVFDLKSKQNINKFHWFPKRQIPCDNRILFENIGEEETRLIMAL
jgi:hypothetical protein